MHPTRPAFCTLEGPNGAFCDAPVAPDAPTSTCRAHAIEIYRYCANLVRDYAPQAIPLDGLPILDVAQLGLTASTTAQEDYVYYLRIGDLIKVGTCRSPSRRFTDYPPNSLLLALERGGPDRETAVLRLFAADLAFPREWFRPSSDLLAHVTEVRALDSVPFSRAAQRPPVVASGEVIVTTPEAAVLAGVHQDTIRRWAADAVLPRMGRRGPYTTYRRSDVLRLAVRDRTRRRQPD